MVILNPAKACQVLEPWSAEEIRSIQAHTSISSCETYLFEHAGN